MYLERFWSIEWMTIQWLITKILSPFLLGFLQYSASRFDNERLNFIYTPYNWLVCTDRCALIKPNLISCIITFWNYWVDCCQCCRRSVCWDRLFRRFQYPLDRRYLVLLAGGKRLRRLGWFLSTNSSLACPWRVICLERQMPVLQSELTELLPRTKCTFQSDSKTSSYSILVIKRTALEAICWRRT